MQMFSVQKDENILYKLYMFELLQITFCDKAFFGNRSTQEWIQYLISLISMRYLLTNLHEGNFQQIKDTIPDTIHWKNLTQHFLIQFKHKIKNKNYKGIQG